MACALLRSGKNAGGQTLRADGDRYVERTVLAGQPWQRAGFGVGNIGVIADVVLRLREDHRSEGGGREIHHLAVRQMRRDLSGDVMLRERRRGTQNEFNAFDSSGDIGGDLRKPHIMRALRVLHRNARTRRAMCGDGIGIAPP